jgi:hypothetical protein
VAGVLTTMRAVHVVAGVLTAVPPVHVVARVIGVARFVNVLSDLGGIVPDRVVPGVLLSAVIVAHPFLRVDVPGTDGPGGGFTRARGGLE